VVFTLDVPACPADRVLFLSGPPPEVGTVLELRSSDARELVLVECEAGTCAVQVMRCFGGPTGRQVPSDRFGYWPRGTRLRIPVEYSALAGGWWECSLCYSPVTKRGRHTEWHEELRASV
jgi:hypothetical protein